MPEIFMGLDVGSTTVKLVVLNNNHKIIYNNYRRHYSNVKKVVKESLSEALKKIDNLAFTIMVTGSGGLYVTDWLEIPFIQEVVASTRAIQVLAPETDVAIELGGEDAKITYFGQPLEQRMNSICAGGTGAFIDQMSSLLETDAEGLNKLSVKHKTIYSIASRCGVFAKTDIQTLINQGVSKEDIAASVLQSVVNQTISNLACGRPIKGKVAFLGGPLHFLPELQLRFVETLKLKDDEIISLKDSQLYVAIGAALAATKEKPIAYEDLKGRLLAKNNNSNTSIRKIEPLFIDEEEYFEFKKRHSKDKIKEIDPKGYKGRMYLGIDAGSTTTKAVVINDDYEILYSYYGNNKGKPLDQSIKILKDIYKKIADNPITYSCVSGYGEELIKAGLKIDHGEVETIAHYKGSSFFQNDVDFILDIGGQDMKSMKINNGVIDDILLNEACSSGCGSFIETFAKSINMDVGEFLDQAIFAENPVDLGSRCTVFMNSMVKQAQKEGASIGDIAAGLSYSVIKNALQKVIKVRNPNDLGDKIVVQGGTFYGDAVLRSFELISGKEAVRPKITGLMGAFGAAILAKEKYRGKKSSILKADQLVNFSYKSRQGSCRRCGNNCIFTINMFSDGSRYITGNRCEKGIGKDIQKKQLPNQYDYKYKRIFAYESLEVEKAKRGIVGIPRVLNIYENYPFWHAFFTELGFRVELSKESSRRLYESGIASIPSETACYPAKIVHGHIMDLIDKDIKFIFYPSVFYETQEDSTSDNHLNCPVVTGYPELIKHNIQDIKEKDILFLNPFINLDDERSLKRELIKALKDFNVSSKEIKSAVSLGMDEMKLFKQDIRREGERILKILEEKNLKAVVLGGRPYHIDPAINHGIPELINSLGMAVLAEDGIAHLREIDRPIRVLDQWTYHSRMYRAAEYVGRNDNLEFIQLNSFGCGLDAVTTDQVHEILSKHNKIYTALKIDEVSNLGAAKIRIRSLKAAIVEKELSKENSQKTKARINKQKIERIQFTKEDRKKHTILIPQMAPLQFKLLERVINTSGYKAVILDDSYDEVVNEGLKYVNNDACYPSIVVIGQFINALKSGKYDLDNTSLLISQTGGMCRASNYVAFLRKSLAEAGYGHMPVISVSIQGIETNPGLTFSLNMVKRGLMAVMLGDLLMRVSLRVRPYEKIKGSANILVDKWIKDLMLPLETINKKDFIKYTNEIVKTFDTIEIVDIEKPKVGIVGEILVKYHPMANNNLIEILEEEGAEVIVNDLMDFLMYCMYNSNFKKEAFGKSSLTKLAGNAGIKYTEHYRQHVREALSKSKRFSSPLTIEKLGNKAEKLVSLGNQYGEGWLLTAEMIELIEVGAENIVCVQPFACLPNHIVGKGMIKGIKGIYPNANIIPIDYDPGASEVNQINRIKLMMSRSKK